MSGSLGLQADFPAGERPQRAGGKTSIACGAQWDLWGIVSRGVNWESLATYLETIGIGKLLATDIVLRKNILIRPF